MDDLLQGKHFQKLLLHRYLKVFDTFGNVRPCSQKEIIRLVDLCTSSDFNKEPNYYGDPATGSMKVEHVKELMLRILLEQATN